MSDESAVSVRFDRDLGTLSINLGEQLPLVTLDNMPSGLDFLLASDSDEDLRPLWISHIEAGTLAKMVAYVLEKVKISAQARAALESLIPRIQAVRDQSDVEPD